MSLFSRGVSGDQVFAGGFHHAGYGPPVLKPVPPPVGDAALSCTSSLCLVSSDPIMTNELMTHLKQFGDTKKRFFMISTQKQADSVVLADVVLLCFDRNCRPSFEQARDTWAKKLHERARNGVPILLVSYMLPRRN